jgi:hypothetical protein
MNKLRLLHLCVCYLYTLETVCRPKTRVNQKSLLLQARSTHPQPARYSTAQHAACPNRLYLQLTCAHTSNVACLKHTWFLVLL